jgi:adenylate cyclase
MASLRMTAVKQFFGELKRRKVYRVAVAYIVVAWVLTQVATQVFPFFEVPNWTVRLVVIVLVLGFPIATILAWAYDITPSGIKRTEDIAPGPRETAPKAFAAAATSVLEKSHRAAVPEERPSIAILPFSNMSGDPEQDYFSDGITEDLITDLSKVSGLFVVARHSAFAYKARPIKAQQIGQELGVAFMLEGSVRKAGSQVRVTAQLINSKNGGHVWAERFDRELTDIFAIQDEITHAIVEQLKVKLLPQEKESIGQAPTDNVEAYTYYLRGRQFQHRYSKSYYELARRMFVKATELDPRYARAYAGIADCDSFLFLQYHIGSGIENILANTEKALALDNRLAEPHASRGFALSIEKRFQESTAEFEQAIALDRNSFEAHYLYGRVSFVQGNLEHAAGLFERAAEINPDDYQSLILLIQIYRSLGRDKEKESAARRGVERAERELILHPEDPRPAYMGIAGLIEMGEKDRAREWITRALVIGADDPATQYNVACGYTKLGETELALDLIERMWPNVGEEIKMWIRHDSDFDALRNHLRFHKILEQTK